MTRGAFGVLLLASLEHSGDSIIREPVPSPVGVFQDTKGPLVDLLLLSPLAAIPRFLRDGRGMLLAYIELLFCSLRRPPVLFTGFRNVG